jgi:hypothetical protein
MKKKIFKVKLYGSVVDIQGTACSEYNGCLTIVDGKTDDTWNKIFIAGPGMWIYCIEKSSEK